MTDHLRRAASMAGGFLDALRRPVPELGKVAPKTPAPTLVASPVRGAVATTLNQMFAEFGIDAHVTGRTTGPTVTCWHVRPGRGVKVETILKLAKTIETRLSPDGPDVPFHIRVLHVVPGSGGVMGVEVPNAARSVVALPDLLAGIVAESSALLVALGVDAAGRPVVIDIADLPHLLIGGQTGAGKSVVLNTIIVSLLSRNAPDDVRLLLIDPKRVELAPFAGVPHLVTPIVTDAQKAVDALAWLCGEMDDRLDRLADAGCRNIAEFNRRAAAGDRMPRLVAVVDELADLMMVSGKEVETSVVRLAQLARAAGIHLVLATQRPSVDVVTGLIKANMPSRLALATASAVDSGTILGAGGAEKLLGRGDALLDMPGRHGVLRVQCALVTDAEIGEVVAVAKSLAPPSAVAPAADPARQPEQVDELLLQAIELVVNSQFGSTAMLQRKMRIGHVKAGALMDAMERLGIVGPLDGSRARDVLIKPAGLPESLARLRRP